MTSYGVCYHSGDLRQELGERREGVSYRDDCAAPICHAGAGIGYAGHRQDKGLAADAVWLAADAIWLAADAIQGGTPRGGAHAV